MRKPELCICENKGADQQRLCFHYLEFANTLLPKSKYEISSLFCGCTARFVSDLIGNPKNRFSNDEAHFLLFPGD